MVNWELPYLSKQEKEELSNLDFVNGKEFYGRINKATSKIETYSGELQEDVFSKLDLPGSIDSWIENGFITENGSEEIKWNYPIYNQNKYGFRTDEWIDQEGIIFLGCSDTYGHYSHEKNTWARIVSKNFDKRCYNLGINGGTIIGCYRLLKRWLPDIKSKTVCLLIPGLSRLELFSYDSFGQRHISIGDKTVLTPPNTKLDKQTQDSIFKLITENICSAAYKAVTLNLALDGIKSICEKNNINLVYEYNPYTFQSRDNTNIKLPADSELGLAMDLAHKGNVYQESIAKHFIRELNKFNYL